MGRLDGDFVGTVQAKRLLFRKERRGSTLIQSRHESSPGVGSGVGFTVGFCVGLFDGTK